MPDEKNKDPERPKRVAAIADDLAKFCGDRQRYHATKAQEYGYSKEIFSDMAWTMERVPDYPMLSAAEVSLSKFRTFIMLKEKQFERLDFDVSSGAYALGTAVTASTGMSIPQEVRAWLKRLDYPKPPSSWQPDRKEVYTGKLEKLDPELAKLYRSVWQSFYGGAENAERAAMLSMRQLYDHLFDTLAPNDQVLNSPYFTPKEGKKPNQIYRKERIKYAANERVKDKELAQALEAQGDYILQVYDQLNKLHKRGELKREEARGVLTAMQTIIEQWIDAIDLR